MERYYTPDHLAELHKRAENIGPERLRQVERSGVMIRTAESAMKASSRASINDTEDTASSFRNLGVA